ncbi:hypothetical protein BaRGS_00003474 [Batillaria attramentaria]|uniref:Uncharacterized protein n=1 Tax=Batillaria attramentaria TaxID=370345 RepID=A0ABD0M0Z9_9CAEN
MVHAANVRRICLEHETVLPPWILEILLARQTSHRVPPCVCLQEIEDGVKNGSIHRGTLVRGPNGPVIVLDTPYSEAWDKKSAAMSDTNSTASSRLSTKNDNSRVSTIKDGNSRVNTLDGKRSKSTGSKKSKRSGTSGKENKHGVFGLEGPLKSSTLKKTNTKNGSGLDIYAVPNKPGFKFLKRQTSSVKYANDPRFLHPDHGHLHLTPNGQPEMQESFWQEPFERSASFREGMKRDGVSRFPVHTLDASRLAQDHDAQPHGPDVYDHVVSFRSYPSPAIPRRDRVVSLEQPHPGYHRLYQHELNGDRVSVHSSRSSLVKL